MATHITTLTRYRDRVLTALPKWRVLGVLTEFVRNAFDIGGLTSEAMVRTIGCRPKDKMTPCAPDDPVAPAAH